MPFPQKRSKNCENLENLEWLLSLMSVFYICIIKLYLKNVCCSKCVVFVHKTASDVFLHGLEHSPTWYSSNGRRYLLSNAKFQVNKHLHWRRRTHSVILIGSDGPKAGFVEDERLKVLRQRQVFILGAHVYHMEARLVTMHRVQNNLTHAGGQEGKRKVNVMCRENGCPRQIYTGTPPPRHFYSCYDRSRCNNDTTHMSVVVELVVRQLQLIEADNLLRPVQTLGRWIGMDVDTRWHVLKSWKTASISSQRSNSMQKTHKIRIRTTINQIHFSSFFFIIFYHFFKY